MADEHIRSVLMRALFKLNKGSYEESARKNLI